MKNSFTFCVLICVSVLILNSCRTLRNKNNAKNTLTLEQIYDSVQLTKLNYGSLRAKFSVKYQNKSKIVSLKGNIKILKDSLIWISLSPGLGFEILRMKCTNDSIYLLDKMNKSLTKGKYNYIKKLWKIDVDYNTLQSILTNQFFIYPDVEDEKAEFSKNFSVRSDSSRIELYRKTEDTVENLIKLGLGTFNISSYLINDVPNLRNLVINYNRGSFANVKNFPEKVSIFSSNAGKQLSIGVSYSKVSLNESLSFPFKVPSSYRLIVH